MSRARRTSSNAALRTDLPRADPSALRPVMGTEERRLLEAMHAAIDTKTVQGSLNLTRAWTMAAADLLKACPHRAGTVCDVLEMTRFVAEPAGAAADAFSDTLCAAMPGTAGPFCARLMWTSPTRDLRRFLMRSALASGGLVRRDHALWAWNDAERRVRDAHGPHLRPDMASALVCMDWLGSCGPYAARAFLDGSGASSDDLVARLTAVGEVPLAALAALSAATS